MTTGQEQASGAADRLAAVRGAAAPQGFSARKIAALLDNPECGRRKLLDAAGVDKRVLADRVGYPSPFGQSPFAIARAAAFAEIVRRDGFAELIRLLRDTLNFSLAEAGVADLADPAIAAAGIDEGLSAQEARHRETVALLRDAASGAQPMAVFGSPMLALSIGGVPAYLEPDAIVHREGGRFTVVGIKAFPVIDGQAPAASLTAAVKQQAVYQIALRMNLAEALGANADSVADDVVLVCPENYSNRPIAVIHNAKQQADAIMLLLNRLGSVERLVGDLPAAADFDLSHDDAGTALRTPGELTTALGSVRARYLPTCRANCDLAGFCRGEAERTGSPALLGPDVRDALPGITSIDDALTLINEETDPSPDQAEAAAHLRRAARLRRESLSRTEGVA